MNKFIILDQDELRSIIEDTARLAGEEAAKLALSKLVLQKDDKISEDEAMKLLGCKKRRLAALRADRSIEFFTTSKPYTYSRKSIMDYIELQRIKKVDL